MTVLVKVTDRIHEVPLTAPECYKHGALKSVEFLRENDLQLSASSITQFFYIFVKARI